MNVHRSLPLLLAAALISAPAMPLLAEETAAPAPTPVATTAAADAGAPAAAAAASGAPEALSTTASDAPDLPEVKEGAVPAEAPEAVSGTAEPDVPQDIIATPGKAKPDVPESPYKWGNFALGFLGGAAIGGAAGVLFLSKGDDGNFDSEKAKVMGPAVGAGAGLVFGLAALFLGTTTPEEAKPPKVESQSPPLPGGPAVADLGVRVDWRF